MIYDRLQKELKLDLDDWALPFKRSSYSFRAATSPTHNPEIRSQLTIPILEASFSNHRKLAPYIKLLK